MLHSFQLNGYNIIMDVNSGAVHVVDEMVYDMVQLLDVSVQDITAELEKRHVVDHKVKQERMQ